MRALHALSIAGLVQVACAEHAPSASLHDASPAPEGRPPCGSAGPAVVTDIDATLTISDEEFVKQLVDGTYEPIAREGGSELLTGYTERGYYIVYATGRSEEMVLAGTGETARDATVRWLEEHAFPLERSTLYLAPTNGEIAGEPARRYKTAKLSAAQAAGMDFRYAYGNAESDILAYADVGIPLDVTFIIGPLAGMSGTVGVVDEGWSRHGADHLPTVPAVCEP